MEVWKPVVGFEGIYEISNEGRIKSLPRIRRNRYGLCNSVGDWMLNGWTNKNGYQMVRVYVDDGKFLTVGIHRLVLEAFVGPCPEGMQACHNDGNPANNCLENLRWDTPKNNQADRDKHGRHAKGSRSKKAKLTETDIPVIRKLLAKYSFWGGMSKVARKFKVDTATIRDIRDGITWGHVEKE